MADPTKFTPPYDFSDYQATNPISPLPGTQIDISLDQIAQSSDTIVEAIKDVRRSDGALKNGIVTPDSLAASMSMGFTLQGAWTDGVTYSAGDGVPYGTAIYKCLVSHTASAGHEPGVDTALWVFLFSTAALSVDDGSVTPPKLEPAQGAAFHAVLQTVSLLPAMAASASLFVDTALTGTPTAPTPSVGDNSTKVATTGFVAAAISAILNGVSALGDTLAELYALILLRAPLADPTFTGVPAGPTAAPGTATTQFATTAFVGAAVSSGSGQTVGSFLPTDNEPPSSNYATFDVRNGHPVLVFPDAVVYAAIFTGVMPRRYVGGGVTVLIKWMNSTTSTNKVCFSATLERVDVGTTDLDADSFGTQVIDTTGVAANATSGIQSQTSIAMTTGANMDSVVAGDVYRLKITRETGQANDTQAGDAQIVSIEIKET